MLGIHCLSPCDFICLHIEADTKRSPFAEDIFKLIQLNKKFKLYYIRCFSGSNQQFVSIGWGNNLVPNRWQAIIWINDGLVYRRICVSLSLNELRI